MDDTARLCAIVRGLWEKDPAAWTDRSDLRESIPRWLGWLTIASEMRRHVAGLTAFAEAVRRDGFTHALLLGMGGSSLAPEVLRRTFGVRDGFLDLSVLDSTDPATGLDYTHRLPLDKTLFVVSTKSGTTTETVSFQRYFEAQVQAAGSTPGRSFVAVTDPGTALEQHAAAHGYRHVFLSAEDIGGRFSALSFFGLVPASLLGIDLDALLDRAEAAMHACRSDAPLAENPGAQLGAALARHAAAGRDKVTLVCPAPFDSFGYWVEQLLAESTGKEGKGLVPVEGEPLGRPDVYGADRVFAVVGTDALLGTRVAGTLRDLATAGHPVLRLEAAQPPDLAYQFFVWEFATAVAGALMGINAFDQPNVQEAKDYTTQVLREVESTGRLPDVPEIEVGAEAVRQLDSLLDTARPGDYLAILAYVPRTPETEAALTAWRTALRDRLKLATTAGFGPRYLHSTGQLHKGGAGTGLFIQLVSDDPADAPIPEAPYSFSTLKQAQAIGDLQALTAHRRRTLRLRVQGDIPTALRSLTP